MTRRLLNLLTALSLLLCVAVVGLWVHSHWAQDALRVRPRDGGGLVIHVFWARGSIACTGTFGSANDEMPPGGRVLFRAARAGKRPADLYQYWGTRNPRFHAGGFAVSRPVPEYGALGGFLIPLWLPALLFALLPLARLHSRSRTKRRRRFNLCPQCGYDLRASPGRCPECGSGSAGA